MRAKERLQDDTEVCIRELLKLKGERFRLDRGHHITFGHFLGNDITVPNRKGLISLRPQGTPRSMLFLAP
jgi:hypothetical protein